MTLVTMVIRFRSGNRSVHKAGNVRTTVHSYLISVTGTLERWIFLGGSGYPVLVKEERGCPECGIPFEYSLRGGESDRIRASYEQPLVAPQFKHL